MGPGGHPGEPRVLEPATGHTTKCGDVMDEATPDAPGAHPQLVWVMPPFLACAVFRTVTAADVATFLRIVCGLFAMYSAGVPALLFGRRRSQLLALLGRARRLSERTEAVEQADVMEVAATLSPCIALHRAVRAGKER